MKVLVTGATGFVGQALLPRLLRDAHAVRAVSHRTTPQDQPQVNWTRWPEAADDAAIARMVDGIEVVVHLAGLAHLRGADAANAKAQFMRVNRDATAALAIAASNAGVQRFIFLSSVKACGEQSGERAWTETDPKQPVDPYGESKAQAEDRLSEIASVTAMGVTVLRPPLVYGPGVRANFLSLLQWIERGIPLPVPGIPNRRSLVYVGNLADALARCIVHPAAAGQTFFVSDGEDVSTAELVRRIGDALGRRARTIRLPVDLLRLGARMLGRGGAADRLAGSLAVDTSRIRGTLGWVPPYTMAHGLQETAKWFRGRPLER